MYSVLIVDDENPALEMLKIIIPWEEQGFFIKDVAYNGKEALEKFEINHYDLIITDIQMPIMNGIELIKKVKEQRNEQQIIILSCHEEFSYAKAAVKMGVKDYLIKDLLTEEDLLSALGKTKETLKSQISILKNSEGMKKYLLMENFLFNIQNEVFKSFITESKPRDIIENYIKNFNLDLKSEKYILLNITEDQTYEAKSQLEHDEENVYRRCIVDTINAVLNSEHYGSMIGGICAFINEGEYIAIVKVKSSVSERRYLSDSYALSSYIKMEIARLVASSISIVISQVYNDLVDTHEMYKQTKDTLQFRFYFGKGKITFYNTMIKKVAPVKPENIENMLSRVSEYVKNRDKKQVVEMIEMIYRDMANGFMQYNYVQFISTRFMEIIISVCKEYNIAYAELFGTEHLPFEEINEMDTIQDFKIWFKNIFLKLFSLLDQKSSYSLRVTQAIKYIKEAYSLTISLNDIAEKLHVNKIYLCRIFKEETKMTMTEYINMFRIEESKRLIKESHCKLYEIAERVGYINIQHFNTCFKKVTGMTPKQYRILIKGKVNPD